MPRHSTPASYRVSCEDLQQVVREHAVEWEATAYFELTLGFPHGTACWQEITIREGIYVPTGRELVRVRYPLSKAVVDRWPGEMLAALMSAYQKLDNEPWLWPASKRRATRGE